MRPNVLLVVLDTARRDVIEPYGAPDGSTPAIAELARRGSALPSAYATASWTLPSHASMFTGLLPSALRLGQPPNGTPQAARPALERVSHRLLPEVLRRAGYATCGWSTNVWASPLSGFDLGFDSHEFISAASTRRIEALTATGLRGQVAWALEGLRGREDDGAAVVGRQLRASIGAWSERPTFWFANLSECHSPYLPPRPWNQLDARGRVVSALEARKHLNFESICLSAAGSYRVPDEALARMRRLQQNAASYLDHWLSDVLGALDRRGILDQTLVIVTSDHGENFGEDGLLAHGFSVDERLIHVPLVMAGPGAIAAERPFSLAELPRLVAAAAGLEDHPWASPQLPAGVVVAEYDAMAGPDDPRIQDFAKKWDLSDDSVSRLCASYRCATDGHHKLVVRNRQELVFDLVTDPGETKPLAPSTANGSLGALRAALEQTEPSTAPAGAGAPPAAPQGSEEELAAIERQMKLLGYM
ncbi:MAG TPA: sulfatase-like hydrolase/transferase [Solirubrobacteraceae bacterium]|jgi:arylsulfatase A-like enzyme